eukprot:3940899-Rhodomonas_salina.1
MPSGFTSLLITPSLLFALTHSCYPMLPLAKYDCHVPVMVTNAFLRAAMVSTSGTVTPAVSS